MELMELIGELKFYGFALSAALQFSLLTLVKRNRRLERLEKVFLALIACFFVWNLSNFLLLLFKRTANPLSDFLLSLVVAPLAFCTLVLLPSLLLHFHLLFQRRVLSKPVINVTKFWEGIVYAPVLFLPFVLIDFVDSYFRQTSILAGSTFVQPYAAWFCLALVASAYFELKILLEIKEREKRVLFAVLILIFLSVACLFFFAYFVSDYYIQLESGGTLEAVLMLWSILPSALLGYYIFRHNFLEVAVQRQIGFPIAAAFLLLIYLLSIRWLRDLMTFYQLREGIAEAALILILFPLLQPLTRGIDVFFDRLFSREISKFERMANRLEEISKSQMELQELLPLIEELLRRDLGLKSPRLTLDLQPTVSLNAAGNRDAPVKEAEGVLLLRGKEISGKIQIEEDVTKLSNEQEAGLRYLVPQIAAAIESCQLLEGKIRLERELAEHSKMASLGQMAATVAHNIKNPLSSIKTIVQLMQEDNEVTERYGRDLALINSEIDRLTSSVSQLLRFSKPPVLANVRVDLAEVLERIAGIFRPDAERRMIGLELTLAERPLNVKGSDEVLAELFQNLIVNALEAAPEKSRVTIKGEILRNQKQPVILVQIEDEGRGISSETMKQIFKPFFTTKQKGTGLGLSVAQRRVLDLGGSIDCLSPVSSAGGTRFEIRLPI